MEYLFRKKKNLPQSIFKALDSMTLTDAATEHKELEKVAYGVDESDQLCEPIRKHLAVRSPVKCLTPTRVVIQNKSVEKRDLGNFKNYFLCRLADLKSIS